MKLESSIRQTINQNARNLNDSLNISAGFYFHWLERARQKVKQIRCIHFAIKLNFIDFVVQTSCFYDLANAIHVGRALCAFLILCLISNDMDFIQFLFDFTAMSANLLVIFLTDVWLTKWCFVFVFIAWNWSWIWCMGLLYFGLKIVKNRSGF